LDRLNHLSDKFASGVSDVSREMHHLAVIAGSSRHEADGANRQ
jgi:hypothetical protein